MNSLDQMLGRAIGSQKDELAKLIMDDQWMRNPQFRIRYGAAGHAKCVQDVMYNLSYLNEAIASGSPQLFANYTDWIQYE